MKPRRGLWGGGGGCAAATLGTLTLRTGLRKLLQGFIQLVGFWAML